MNNLPTLFFIGGDTVKRKIVPILLIAILIINIIPVKKSYAWTGPAMRIVAGSTAEKVLIGMSEKAGMKFATKSARDKALRKWNMDLDELIRNNGNVETQRTYQEFIDQMNALDQKVVPIKGNTNYGQVVVDTAMFMVGLDILYDGYIDIHNAVLKNEYVDGYTQAFEDGNTYKTFGRYHYELEDRTPGSKVKEVRMYRDDVDTGQLINFGYGFYASQAVSYYMTLVNGIDGAGNPYSKLETRFVGPYAGDGEHSTKVYTQINQFSLDKKLDFSVPATETWIPKTDELPDLSPLPPAIMPLTEPGISPVPIEVPDSIPDETSITIPINDPMPIDPLNDPIKENEKEPDTGGQPDTGTNPNPDTGTDTGTNLTPKPNKDVLPQPAPLPELEPTVPGDETPTDEDTPTKRPGDTKDRWSQLVTNKFPFSLPWDLADMISSLMADPKRPNVKVDITRSFAGKEVNIKFSHDFKWMDDWIGFTRIFILIGFSVFLITSTRKLLGGGQ